MDALRLQKKRQRKEAKRNVKRKAVRVLRNNFLSLGRAKMTLSLERTRRTAGIKFAIANLDAIVKRWSDKVSEDLAQRIDQCKCDLKNAMKTKQLPLIDEAIKAFVPVNEEVIEICKKYDKEIN